MSVNEIEFPVVSKPFALNNRVLAALGFIGAPMLLIEMVIRALMKEPEKLNEQFVGALGVFYIGGWIATTVGVRRIRATGNGLASRIVFIIQIIGLVLAFLFSAQEIFGVNHKNGGLFFTITDIAYPFSHVFMLAVGALIWRAHNWKGLERFALFFVGLMLPLFFALAAVGNTAVATVIPSGLAAIGFAIIAFAVLKRN